MRNGIVVWKDISGLPGYEVSSSGHVRNKETRKRLAENVNGSSSRYLRVTISKRHYAVHRLVAMAFIPNPEGYAEVDHISRDKTDNGIANLRWVDHRTNIIEWWASVMRGESGKTARRRNKRKGAVCQ